MKNGLEQTPNIRPSTAFRILASGPESLPPKTTIKLLAEKMRQQMEAASRASSGAEPINFNQRRRARQLDGRRIATTKPMPASGKDNYGEYAPLARREMI